MEGKEKLHFFYDESFHDRTIKIKKENINIYADNASDIFVGVFIGCKSQYLQLFYDQFEKFENKYRTRFTLNESQELKGITIQKKNFKYGVSSFNRDCLEFYNDYFDLIKDNVIFHICMFSKTAFYISEAFKRISIDGLIYNENAFLYSLIKFLYHYRYDELLLRFFSDNKLQNSKEIIELLKKLIKEVIKNLYGVKRKAIELEVLKQILYILDHANVKCVTQEKYLWDYKIIFKGFNLLLKERKISTEQVNLIIDNDEDTYNAAIETSRYFSTKQGKSDLIKGIRIADILSNFIGRMIQAIDNDLKEEVKNIDDLREHDHTTKRMLNVAWFDINEQRFQLYIKINDIFMIMKQYGSTTHGLIYFDYSTLFFALMQYFGRYKSYSEFRILSNQLHSEYFNTYSCRMLEERFKEF
jgi:hypothetical protein